MVLYRLIIAKGNEMIRLLREKKNQLILMVILLVTFSWVPTLDNYSDDYTDASILQAGAA